MSVMTLYEIKEMLKGHENLTSQQEEMVAEFYADYGDRALAERMIRDIEAGHQSLENIRSWYEDLANKPKAPTHHYEKLPYTFSVGEDVHNFNGSDYRVLEKFTEDKIFLKNLNTDEYVGAGNIHLYNRYEVTDEGLKKNFERGVEWDYGIYLGKSLKDIDFTVLKERLGVSYSRDSGMEYQKVSESQNYSVNEAEIERRYQAEQTNIQHSKSEVMRNGSSRQSSAVI